MLERGTLQESFLWAWCLATLTLMQNDDTQLAHSNCWIWPPKGKICLKSSFTLSCDIGIHFGALFRLIWNWRSYISYLVHLEGLWNVGPRRRILQKVKNHQEMIRLRVQQMHLKVNILFKVIWSINKMLQLSIRSIMEMNIKLPSCLLASNFSASARVMRP